MGNSCSDLCAVEDDQFAGNPNLRYVEKTYKNGAVYKGQMDYQRNVRHGKGMFSYTKPVGAVYDGQWTDDKCHGKGRFKDDESEYYGQWQFGQKHGDGKETWHEDGTVYEGKYECGEKHGEGIYNWGDGSSYRGQFKNDDIHGKGRYDDKDGVYEGDFLDSMHHGEGTYRAQDGSVYSGQWFEGDKHGKGVLTWNDGRKYDGQWQAGVQHGKGKFLNRKGELVDVFYFEGEKCSETELEQKLKDQGKTPSHKLGNRHSGNPHDDS